MKKISAWSGKLTAYQVSTLEMYRIGGSNRCDQCNDQIPEGYLVPSLHCYLCPTCFRKWNSQEVPEDLPIMKKRDKEYSLYYEKYIGLT